MVDLIGPYESRRDSPEDPLIIKALNMIDPATKWFTIIEYNDKQAATIANLVEKIWLCRYPRPTIIMYDHVNELLGRVFINNLIKND